MSSVIKEFDEEIEVLRKKAKYFLAAKESVHVSFKKDYWRNGVITEVSSDFFLMNDFVKGKIVVFFLEIKNIDTFREVRNGD